MRGDLKKISFLSLSWKGRQLNTDCVIFRGWCGGLPGGKAFYNLGCVFLLLFWGCYLFVFIFLFFVLFSFRYVFYVLFLSLLKNVSKVFILPWPQMDLLQAALWQGAIQVDGMAWAKTNTDCNIAIKIFQQN